MKHPEVEAAWHPLLLSAGAGLLNCQRLEYGLGLLLLYLGKAGVPNIDVERMRAVLDEREVCTAGRLRSLLSGKVDVGADADAVLVEAVKSRNHLVHRFLIKNSGRFMDAAERDDVLRELRDLRQKMLAAQDLLRPLLDDLSRQVDGVPLKAYEDLALRVFHGLEKDPWGRPTSG